jgi:hypothetical protein
MSVSLRNWNGQQAKARRVAGFRFKAVEAVGQQDQLIPVI